MKTKDLGDIGEESASQFLLGKGYKILERNYVVGKYELDIIARKKKVMVFVEVKARSSSSFGFPEEAVDERKQEALMRAAEHYMEQEGWKGDIRFDIVSVDLTTMNIHHFEDAFY